MKLYPTIIKSIILVTLLTSCTAGSERINAPTALCEDGSYSYSINRSGTCSHHGGVDQWLS
jgi:hypothetical protein